MHNLMPFLYLISVLIAAILFLNMLAQAFNRSFMWGIACLLFPPGTYIYCKNYWAKTKYLAIPLLISVTVAIAIKILIMFN